MLRAHRQAWCWQDEYFGLTMDDIRRLERETQAHLAEKMAAAKAAAEEGGEATPVATTPTNTVAKQPPREGNAVHFTEQGAVEGEGGGERAEDTIGYNRSVSRESRGSTSTLVNGAKSVRQSRTRASGEIVVLFVWVTAGQCYFSGCVWISSLKKYILEQVCSSMGKFVDGLFWFDKILFWIIPS